MNTPAVELYRDHGIDLERGRLEIAVCAQHNNGGLAANTWWESNLEHLFPVGEVCGTHGVRRPGGSALNAGQVGAIRAARYIAHNYDFQPPPPGEFGSLVADQVENCLDFCLRIVDTDGQQEDGLLPNEVLAGIQDRMSRYAAQVRDPATVLGATKDAWRLLKDLDGRLRVVGPQSLPVAFRVVDLCLTHAVYLEAIGTYLTAGGGSRGGVMVLDADGKSCGAGLSESWNYRSADPECDAERKILEVSFTAPETVITKWVDARPIPESDGWFEQVWASFRAGDVYTEVEEDRSGF